MDLSDITKLLLNRYDEIYFIIIHHMLPASFAPFIKEELLLKLADGGKRTGL